MVKNKIFFLFFLFLLIVVAVGGGYITGFFSADQSIRVWMCKILMTPDPLSDVTLDVVTNDVLNLDIDASTVFHSSNTNPPSTTVVFSDNTPLFDIGASDGIINYQPLAGDAGTYIVTITASEASDLCLPKSNSFTLTVIGPPSTGGGRGGCTVRYSCESTWGECEKANGYSLQERLCHQTCGYPDFTERKGCLPSGCYSADDCGRVAWFDCIGGECVAKECVTDDDCAPYFECVDGTCEPVGILEIEEIPIEMPGRISFLKEESVLFPTTDEIRGYYTHKINIKEMVNFFPVYNLFYEPTTTPLAAIVKESDWITKAFAAFTAFLLFLLIAYLITRERKYVPPETE